ncbi:hypothetical protein LSAT2_020101 [Lamellibrachia satsuma]|nr:hypothetical protein LSAT2_020101 [Lamellibrachia satsuma]
MCSCRAANTCTTYCKCEVAELYWVSTVGVGHEKVKTPEIRQKRHQRSEKREATKEASAAAESLLLLQAVDEGASPAIPEEEDLSVGIQTVVDSIQMGGCGFFNQPVTMLHSLPFPIARASPNPSTPNRTTSTICI